MSSNFIPDSVPKSDRATAVARLRYEDVSQDGRVKLVGIANTYGLVWQELLTHHPVGTTLPRSGVLALLTRILVERGDGPIGVGRPVSVDTAFQLAHGIDDSGRVNRLYLICP